MRNGFDKSMAFRGALFLDDELILDEVMGEVHWTEPGPMRFVGHVSCSVADELPPKLNDGQRFEIRGFALDRTAETITIRHAYVATSFPSRTVGLSFAFAADQLEFRKSSVMSHQTQPASLTVRVELVQRRLFSGTHHDLEDFEDATNRIWRQLERLTGAPDFRSRRLPPPQATPTPLEDASVYFGTQKSSGRTYLNGIPCRASVDFPVIEIAGTIDNRMRRKERVQQFSNLLWQYVLAAAFLDSAPPLSIWKHKVTTLNGDSFEECIRIFTTLPDSQHWSRPLAEEGVGELITQMVATMYQLGESSGVVSGLYSYFTAMRTQEPRQRFLNLYLALEAVTSAFLNERGEESWVGDSNLKKKLKTEVVRFVQEFLREEGRHEEVPRDKVEDMLRASARQNQIDLFKHLQIQMDDLGLEGGSSPQNSNAFPWIRVRNQLFHQGKTPDHQHLVCETERLKVLVERVLLRSLGVQSSSHLSPDKAFNPTAETYEYDLW